MSGVQSEIREYGELPCTKCGEVHHYRYRKPGQESAGASWAHPGDGHPYYHEEWADVGKRLWREQHGDPNATTSDRAPAVASEKTVPAPSEGET